jgi:hypothetical protein
MPFAVGGKSYPSGESLYLTMFPVKSVYSFVYTGPKTGKEKGTRDVASPLSIGSSGGRIRTSDLRVMSQIRSKNGKSCVIRNLRLIPV